MANSILHKTPYTFTTIFFILLSLIGIIFFSKHTLEPSLSLYHDFFSPINTRTASVPLAEANYSSGQIVSGTPPMETTAPSSRAENVDNQTPTTEDESEINNNQISAKDGKTPLEEKEPDASTTEAKVSIPFASSKDQKLPIGHNVDELAVKNMKTCDIYTGTWVKHEQYPIYKPGSCPYVDEAFDCQINGRRDSDYLRWRWKPDGCHLPRFNATDFLVRLRGKRLMLVGDSMNRNQFESILCLLREGLPDKNKMFEIYGHNITKGRGYYVFRFADYNCTVEFVRSHFLVKEGVRINGDGNSNPTLSIDLIDKTSGRWKGADILVFNTAHWWVHGKTARGINYFKERDYLYPKFDAVEAYRRALRTWAKWVDQNVKPGKQLVFYRGFSSSHFSGGDWDSGGSCTGESQPIMKGAFLESYPLKMKIVEEVIREMKVPVILLNVTKLTNSRKDGHPSVFGKSPSKGKVSSRRQDCSHWCLPGVPDTWNELIYSTLVFQQNNLGG